MGIKFLVVALNAIDAFSAKPLLQTSDDQSTDPNPFRRKADPDKIIAAASLGHQTLDSIH